MEKLEKEYFNEKEISDYSGISVSALRAWRFRGVGPTYVKVSRRLIRYKITDFEDWMKERQVKLGKRQI